MTNSPHGAPALDRTAERWCEDLVVALRLRDVPGGRIGAVLAEVRAHLADSGEDPAEAFGEPGEYAAALTAAAPAPTRRERALGFARRFALVTGVWWAVGGAGALLGGEAARVTAPSLLVCAVVALVGPGLVERLATARRVAGLAWAAGAGAATSALAVAGALADQLTDALSAPVPALALLLPGLVLASWGALSGGSLRPDPVVDPLAAAGEVRRARRSGAAHLAVAWAAVVLLAVAAVALSALAANR
ncbi:hypothetical protein MO973_34430 [Paenibacillus sp. TRM 82003]|uniref:hypothetical protein n=1 Tax=Kineococcus sp. TRM81007 TaxID=2925831 RepID=UPI001F57E2CF|nr:hypothetical protein [Kineococcus sp. TRM81007]MCI2237201.1 hypothetical protein [Kineococcus sp. TRM81007]MCI3925321.1 hypothetical protein [Paenibacillus sp. TRM 82003]